MDRRSFLKSLLAFGTSIAIPFEVSTASDNDFNEAWSELLESPPDFYVDSAGTLFTQNEEYFPGSRAELYDLGYPNTRKQVVAMLRNHSAANDALDNFFYELPEEEWEGGKEKWIMTASEEKYQQALDELHQWLDDGPDGYDWESATLSANNGQGEALRLFEDIEEEVLEALHISIIYGEHPGSSYYAAQMAITPEQANAIAQEKSIPLRFAWQSAA